MELGSGLHFPAVEHFTDVLRAHAIHGDTHTHTHSTMHANTVLDKDPWNVNVSLSVCLPAVSPPRCVVLDCQHVSSIDYTAVNELRDVLKQFKLHGVALVFSGLKVNVTRCISSDVLVRSPVPSSKVKWITFSLCFFCFFCVAVRVITVALLVEWLRLFTYLLSLVLWC